ncbi:MAG: hypothetical protein K2K81_05300 [Muribaculaceae bacterium]|nr:hypothetical protein [Muribaculaceae bacterium]
MDIIDFLGLKELIPLFNNENNKDENIAYTTDLPNVDITAFAADSQLGPNANFQQYYDWSLKKKRKEAWQKAQFVRAGFAPLKTKAADTGIIEGDSLKRMQKRMGDTIQQRHNTGVYLRYPFLMPMDSALYKRMESPCSGYSCINSQTNYFGSRFANMNNINFEKNHSGFRPIPLDSLQQGDIVQVKKNWETGFNGERPAHAILFDHYDSNGDIRAWDQHGTYGMRVPNLEKFLYKSPDNPNEPQFRAKNGFRFIGDPKFKQEVIEKFNAYLKRNGREEEIERLKLD